MAKRICKRRVTKKVNLRTLFDNLPGEKSYAKFIKDKVTPIIGASALHDAHSTPSSRRKEYLVTQRNLDRLCKHFNVTLSKPKVKSKGISAGDLVDLLKATIQPAPTVKYPINHKIPIHPISHNDLYKAGGGRMYRTTKYNKWRKDFFSMAYPIIKIEGHGVDFDKPVEVIYKFGHRERSDRGYLFDRSNFQKAVQDCVFEVYGFDDSKVLDSSIKGEFVEEYKDGYIEFKIRNT